MNAHASAPEITSTSESAKLPAPQPREFFALSIATSAGERSGGRAPVLDVLEVAKVFREDFGVRFTQHVVCSDTAPAAADPALSLRSASLDDIQRAMQDVARRMAASHGVGKQQSFLLHLSMQLSAQDDASAGTGSSDALVLHPSDSLSSGAVSDGYLCAWLRSLPPCSCLIFAQMRGCHRPLKLTEFIAHAHFRGILISSCDLDASSAAELLRLMKNLQHYSAAQTCRALATFARGRLGVSPLQQQQSSSSSPFFFSVNASLGSDWLGRAVVESDGGADVHPHEHAAATASPALKAANQVQSLRKALQLRQSAANKLISLPSHSPLQPAPALPLHPPALSAPQLPHSATPAPTTAPPMQPSPSPLAEAQLRLGGGAGKVKDSRALLTSARWMSDSEAPRCCDCNAEFTMFNRRHHCRVCGRVLDGRCCSKFCLDAPTISLHVADNGGEKPAQVTELVCFACQADIQQGMTPEQAAANRALPVRFADNRHGPHALDLRSPDINTPFVHAPPVTHQMISRVAAPAGDRLQLDEHAAAAGVFGAALTSQRGAQQSAQAQRGSSLDRTASNMQVTFANAAAHNEHVRADGGNGTGTARRRALSAASPLRAAAALRLSDLREEDAAHVQPAEYATRSMQMVGDNRELLRRSRSTRLPIRVTSTGGSKLASARAQANESRAPRDTFADACAALDSIADGLCDPDLAPDVASQVLFDAFVEWAGGCLALPPHVAQAAAAAAYRQTRHAYKAATRNLRKNPGPGIPRSLFPMLVLNFKLELQKHDMRQHAGAAAAARASDDYLPSGIQGWQAGMPRVDASFADIGDKIRERRAKGSEQVGIAASEIETVLQASGLCSEDCKKAAADLVNAGARDLRSMVQLLQQDGLTLSRLGLQPSHVLRVLKNMARQPAFAAEPPSFRLSLPDD